MHEGSARFAFRSITPVLGLALLGACASSGTFQGKLIDPATGQPRANVPLVAKAKSGGDVTCQSREVTSGADGTFTIPDTCADHSYVLTTTDETLILQGDLKFDGGKPAEGVRDIDAWRAPKGEGVYVVTGDTITEVRKSADIYWEPLFPDPKNADVYEKIRYPSVVPNSVPNVAAGSWLAIAGEDNVKDLKFAPLIAHAGAVNFPHLEKGDGTVATISDASWVGVKFKSKTMKSLADIEKVEAALDAAKVRSLKGGGWATNLLPADALPAGRYALLSDTGSRMYIVDFGAAAAPAEAAATGEAK